MIDLPLTIQDAAAALRAGSVTSVQLTEAMIARANELDAKLGVYIRRMDETAMEAAVRADAAFAAGVDLGPLQGIPLAVKDIIATDDAPTTAQSLVLDPTWGSQGDAPVVKRLRAAGAVITGKTSTMEFANGLPDPDKPFPVPHNPWDLERWTGGSSSGTAAGIAAGLFYGGLGTDTGGSIRSPAAFCGISGIKPTFGLVPKNGCTFNGFSLDHIGPMARSAWDCAAMLQALAGYDPGDACSVDVPVPLYLAQLSGSVEGLSLAVERENHTRLDGVLPEAVDRFETAVGTLASAGAAITEISFPHWSVVRAAHTLTSHVEKYVYHKVDMPSRWQDYGRNTRFSSAQGVLVDGADYVQAQRVRNYAVKAVLTMMQPFDALVVPTAGRVAPKLEGLTFEAQRLGATSQVSFTGAWNFLGFPALAIPMGFSEDGLPLSLQIVGKPFQEAMVFQVADAFQRLTDWHRRVPPIAKLEGAVA
jgi:aspartyl-tRNA(Asn)/glutamyl-tRNA(Gln) amidotransferase subunit A